MKKVFIHSTDELPQPRFIKHAKQVTYTRGDKLGTKSTWEYAPEPHDTVHVLVNKTDSKELLLVQQTRIPVLINQPDIANGVCIEACAGLVDSNLTPDCIAHNEVLEELGYDLIPRRSLVALPPLLSAVGTKGSTLYPFYCEVTDADFVGTQLGLDEDIITYKLPYKDIKDFLENTSNTDTTTKMLLQWYLLNKGQ